MSKREELFNEIILLKQGVQSLASIVQNPIRPSKDELYEWNEQVKNFISEVSKVTRKVDSFYTTKLNPQVKSFEDWYFEKYGEIYDKDTIPMALFDEFFDEKLR